MSPRSSRQSPQVLTLPLRLMTSKTAKKYARPPRSPSLSAPERASERACRPNLGPSLVWESRVFAVVVAAAVIFGGVFGSRTNGGHFSSLFVAGRASALCFCFPIVNHKEGRRGQARRARSFFPPDSSFVRELQGLARLRGCCSDFSNANGTVMERCSFIHFYPILCQTVSFSD